MEYEDIIERLLDNMPSTQDTRESTVAYQILAATAVEMKNIYDTNDTTNAETFADTATLEGLTRRGSERGLTPKQATEAVLKGEFDVDVPIGSRFFYDELTYIVTEKNDDSSYKLKCEQAGDIGNSHVGNIIPIQSIEKLTRAEITEVLVPGEDEESTEDFRKTYFDSFNNISYGWNKAMYKTYVDNLQGIGGVLVLPHTNESMETQGGHVMLILESSSYGVPSQTLVDNVKKILDPTDGDGDGAVSIDHCVHCKACGKTVVNIASTITYEVGYSFETLKDEIEKTIDAYLQSLNKNWEDEQVIVRIARVESALLGIRGIIDISDTSLNGEKSSLTIDRYNIVERGTFNG